MNNKYVVVEVNKENGHLTYLSTIVDMFESGEEYDEIFEFGNDIDKAALFNKDDARYVCDMWKSSHDGIFSIMKKEYNVTFNANEMGAIHALISTIKDSVDSDMYIIYEKNTKLFDKILEKIWEAN